MRVERFTSATELVDAVAEQFVGLVSGTGSAGTSHVVLTGGSVAELVHRRIAGLSAKKSGALSGVNWWWGDERWVAADSGERNAGQALAALLGPVGVDPARIHAMPAPAQGLDLDEAAVHHAAELEHALGTDPFDLVMLSLGPDGHLASLFPGRDEMSAPGSVVAVRNSPKPPPERLSLTMERLLDARRVWLFVSGEAKREALDAVLAPDGSPVHAPARALLPHPSLTLFTDLPPLDVTRHFSGPS